MEHVENARNGDVSIFTDASSIYDDNSLDEFGCAPVEAGKAGARASGLAGIWHHRPSVAELAERVGTNIAGGLHHVEVEKRLARFGPNVLSPPLQTPWWRKLFQHFTDMFSLMLQLAAVLCFIAFISEPSEPMHLYLGVFLILVVISTSLFSYLQQFKSDQTLLAFRNFLPPKAIVRREGGRTHVISAADLVVGDVVQIKMGDKIPADMRIVYNNRLKVDNSALTGESEPVDRTVDATSVNPLESGNLAFFGTLAVDGAATGVVVATGDHTVFGEIARMTSNAQHEQGETTLQLDIHHFVLCISIFSFVIGIAFFAIGVAQGTHFIHNLVYTIGIIVSNVPEGLLATVTVSLTASARRMSRRNVLVKQLDAVETLGSTTVICSDKTGTLTQNRMSVAHIAYGGRVEVIHGKWAPPQFATGLVAPEDEGSQGCLDALIFGASICSTAVFDAADMTQNPGKSIQERTISGDASEAGILRFVESIHCTEDIRNRHALVGSIPFNSKNKFMATTNRSPGSDLLRVVLKGAPERVLERCTDILAKSGERPMTRNDRALIAKQMSYLASRGERVLGFAELRLSPQQAARILQGDNSNPSVDDIPTTGLCFVGLISLMDPPRENVPLAVQTCKDAGIRVIMVTGDHPETAASIAKQVGVITKSIAGEDDVGIHVARGSALVVHGSDIIEYTESTWNEVLAHDEIVFARTSPHQKLLIVQQLQRLGEIVTVTGDGCNDAPALKQANTGVAMGISGSEVSREAADIVLLDDNFGSIVNGVEEGRLIFDNLKKSIAYSLTSNIPQLIPFMAYILLRIPLPLTTVLILSIDLGTDIFPAISLAYEKPEWDIMRRPPRNAKKDHLLTGRLLSYATLQLGVIQTCAGFFAYFVVLNDFGLAPSALLGLDSHRRFGSEKLSAQRWLYVTQDRAGSSGYEASWFSVDNPTIGGYFQKAKHGFSQQSHERYNLLPAPSGAATNKTTDENSSSAGQFQNMVKIIGHETGRPPCMAYTCRLSASSDIISENDMACFDPKFNEGPVLLPGIATRTRNKKVRTGSGIGQGCFELWTPRQERESLRRAQTAFFAAIVIAQMFAILSCKTRLLSFFQTGIANSALVFSLFLESVAALVLVYAPGLRYGLDVRPLHLVHWLPGVPFGAFILAYDEVRKCFIRRHIAALETERREAGRGLHVLKPTMLDRISRWVHDFTLW